MELSIFIAKIIAIIYISIGIGVIGKKGVFKEMIKDFEKSSGLAVFSGFITIILGMLLIRYHNIWVKDWTVIVTIFGWMALFKGIVLLAYPKFILKFKNAYNGKEWGYVVLIIGLIFGYLGFIK